MVNFNDALKTRVSEIERPPLIPNGTYRGVVTKVPEQSKVGKNEEWDVLDFNIKLNEAMDDVDQEDLATFGGLKSANIRHRFMFDTTDEAKFNRTLFNLKRFLGDHLRVEIENVDLKEALANTVNQPVMVVIQARPDKNDPEVSYAEIKKTAPAD